MSKVTVKEVSRILNEMPTSAALKSEGSDWSKLKKKFAETRKTLETQQGAVEKAMEKGNKEHRKLQADLRELVRSCTVAEEILADAIEENKEALAFHKAEMKRMQQAFDAMQDAGEKPETVTDDTAEMTSQLRMMVALTEQHALSAKQAGRQAAEHQRIVKAAKKLKAPVDKLTDKKKAAAK